MNELAQYNTNYQPQRRIVITKVLLFETGTYHTQMRRPYTANLTAEALTLFQERLEGASSVKASGVAGVAHSFISPQTTPEGEVHIPHGFGERRFRFMIEFLVETYTGAQITEVLSGYSERLDMSYGGHIDPLMTFYINAAVKIRHTVYDTPQGRYETHGVVNHSQFLSNPAFAGMATQQDHLHRMRPTDVYATMSRQHLSGFDSGEVFDARTTSVAKPVKSKRENAVPTNFVASVIENMRIATITAGQKGPGAIEDVFQEARYAAGEEDMAKDDVIQALNNIKGDYTPTFSWRDLQRLDPNVDGVTLKRVSTPAQPMALPSPDEAMHWAGTDRHTLVATILTHALPGIMSDLTLMTVSFKMHNLTIHGQPMVEIFGVNGFSNGQDMAPVIQHFEYRLLQELIPDISYNNQISFAITASVDLMGDTIVHIQLDGGPSIPYCAPSFCDSLSVPVVTNNLQQSEHLANSFDSLISTLVSDSQEQPHRPSSGIYGKL